MPPSVNVGTPARRAFRRVDGTRQGRGVAPHQQKFTWKEMAGLPVSKLSTRSPGLLVAELADNDGWKMLIAMAEAVGQDDLARGFTEALAEGDQHLLLVRRWLAECLTIQLGAKMPSVDFGQPAEPV